MKKLTEEENYRGFERFVFNIVDNGTSEDLEGLLQLFELYISGDLTEYNINAPINLPIYEN